MATIGVTLDYQYSGFFLANGADDFQLPVTQEELAGMVGASRERVNKAIASFIRLGWLEQHDRNYTIVQRDRLELRAR